MRNYAITGAIFGVVMCLAHGETDPLLMLTLGVVAALGSMFGGYFKERADRSKQAKNQHLDSQD